MRSDSALPLAVLLCMVGFAELTSIRQVTGRRNELLHALFETHVLWNSYIRTVRECAVLCSTDTRCAAFTFLKNSSQSGQLCRGYSDGVADLNQGDHENIPAAAFYELTGRQSALVTTTSAEPATTTSSEPATTTTPEPATTTTPEPATTSCLERDTWVRTACNSDSDCSQLQDDTTCFQGSCVCTPGFFYSICSATCVSECPPGNLAESYTKYPDRYISGHNEYDRSVGSVEECLTHCTADPNCLSIDFRSSDNHCRISYSVATSPGATLMTSSGSLMYDYLQRHCA